VLRKQPRIVLVTRGTRMEGLLERWSTKGQAKFAFKQAKVVARARAGDYEKAMSVQADTEDADFMEMEDEDDTYHAAVRTLKRELDFGMPVQEIDRRFLPNFDFDLATVVVVVGQDGLVANTAKYVGNVAIVGVNPDPARFDGVLLPYQIENARNAVAATLNQRAQMRDVTLAQATLHDGQTMLAFNDFFVGAGSHVSARYELTVGDVSEPQSSSGLLVSTGAGSTGWMSSVYNMACGMAQWLGTEPHGNDPMYMDWDSSELLWAVREPFLSQRSGISLVAGRVEEGTELTLESRMDTGGVIFSDGIQTDYLNFNAGAIVRIGVAEQRAKLVVPTLRRGPSSPHV
jgi:NAD kinase